jgi:hypothetical protein
MVFRTIESYQFYEVARQFFKAVHCVVCTFQAVLHLQFALVPCSIELTFVSTLGSRRDGTCCETLGADGS